MAQSGAEHDRAGAHLAWRDLTVTASWASGGSHLLLDGVTGYAEPGRITAIMGPSGSGKSTLLDTLAGRLAKNARQAGHICLNGNKQRLSYGVAAYVTQDDNLLGTLTVFETIMYSAFFRLPDRMPRAQKMEIINNTIQEMGLQEAVHTPIGNWHLRGVSGGERRRITIALELLTKPRLLFLDEPTSGLDSAAAFFVTTTLKNLARDGRTVITSIHQPSSEVFELFDDLVLLSGGRTIYFGAAVEANQHFVDSGIPCPPWRNPADHFLRAINSDFDKVSVAVQGSRRVLLPSRTPSASWDDQDLADPEDLDPLEAMSTASRVDMLVSKYKSSSFAQNAADTAERIFRMNGTLQESTGSEASTLMQCFTLTRRSFVNMSRDVGYYWLRLAMYLALCLAMGTIFYKVGNSYDAIQARAACLTFVVSFLTFMAIGGFPSFVEEMKVFSRERLNGHYGVGAFVISSTLSSLPFLLLIAFISGASMYFLVDLHPGFIHFLYFVLVIFSTTSAVEGLMMAISSVVPNFLMGIVIGAGIQGFFMLVGGFFRLPNDLPNPVWRYPISYIAFHTYGFQGLFENDFLGLQFRPRDYPQNQVLISGEEVVHQYYQVLASRGKWENLGILFLQVFLYRCLFFIMIKLNEKLGPSVRLMFTKRTVAKHVIQPIPSKQASPRQNSTVI